MMNPFASALKLITDPATELVQTVSDYDLPTFGSDALAGLTVAVVELPQAMAYALIAGVPAQYGIFTSIVQGIIGSLFASNDLLATGPTNTQSLLIAAVVSRLVMQSTNVGGAAAGALYLKLAIGLTLVKGIIQIVFALAKMGSLVRYVSRSVIIGFTAGAGILIMFGQLPNFLGISTGDTTSALPGLLGGIHRLAVHLPETNTHALALGGTLLILLIALKRLFPKAPGPLIVVVLGAAAVASLGWTSAQLRLVGQLPVALPRPKVPSLSLTEVEALLVGAAALAVLGMIETVGIGKSIAMKTGQRIDANREFMAQGIANVVGSFCQNIPGSGSFTRTALNEMAGARTRFAGVFNSLIIATLFLTFGSQARYIPLTALAAVLFIVAWGLIDWRQILRTLRASRGEGLVCIATLASALLLPLTYAIFVGVGLSLWLYMYHSGKLRMREMVQSSSGVVIERSVERAIGSHQAMVFVQVDGDLAFSTAHQLEDRLLALEMQGTEIIILRLKRCWSIDMTALTFLERVTMAIRGRGGHVIFCGVQPQVFSQFEQFGLIRTVGSDNVIPASRGGFESAKKALRRGRELLGQRSNSQLPIAEEAVEFAI